MAHGFREGTEVSIRRCLRSTVRSTVRYGFNESSRFTARDCQRLKGDPHNSSIPGAFFSRPQRKPLIPSHRSPDRSIPRPSARLGAPAQVPFAPPYNLQQESVLAASTLRRPARLDNSNANLKANPVFVHFSTTPAHLMDTRFPIRFRPLQGPTQSQKSQFRSRLRRFPPGHRAAHRLHSPARLRTTPTNRGS